MPNTRPTLFHAVSFAASLGTTWVGAQDVLGDLEPTIVTASRVEDSVMEVPYTFDLIDSGFLYETKRRSLPEALQFTPGILVQKTAYGHGSPFIRGFTGRQNLLLVDGVRFNNSLTRGGPVQYWNTVDPYSLDRIEVIKSQGSVLYGSDAVGGTVNAITRSTGFRDTPDGEFFSHGSAYYEYRSNGEGSHIGRIESSTGVGGRFGIMLGVTGKEFGDIEDSAVGRMRNTGYPEQDIDLKIEAAIGPDTTMTFLHQRVNQDDIYRWHSTIYNPGWQHSGHVAAPGSFLARVYDQERTLTYLRFEGEPSDVGWLNRWSATVSYHQGRDMEAQYRSMTDKRYQVADIDTLGFDLTLESPLGPGELIYGLDYYHDTVDSAGYRDRGVGLLYDPSFRPVADDSEYDLFGAFAQYSFRPVECLEITAGGRYTYARAELGRSWNPTLGRDLYGQSRSWDNFSGSLRALWTINDCWNVYGGISQAFRAPNLNDLSGVTTSRFNTNATGSIDVDSEEFITYELGTRFHNGTFGFGAAVFYTDASDLITSVPVAAGSNTTVPTNAADAYVYGVELEADWRFAADWLLSGYFTWQDGRTDTQSYLGGPTIHDLASRTAPISGGLALRWTHPNERLWVEGRMIAAAEQDNLSRGDRGDTQRIPVGGTPGYIAYMLHAGWQATDWLELTGGVENISDEDYRNHGSGQNEPGLNGIFAAKVTW
ncbi:TonB-dependent receptor [Haloferula helveola]|uniref:TonB-dependent receptor n=1 Tax=Haloferula helveola TaxID=490095 RepID=A0ABN6H6I4_9BACT|nr:TonB-dependent receptor [Haloferula helveola]